MANLDAFKDEKGKFLWFAWPGAYAYIYLDKEANTFCPGCADEVDPEFDLPIITGYIHWEGPSEWCAGCNKEMGSEYGDPDADEVVDGLLELCSGPEENGMDVFQSISNLPMEG